MPSLLMIIRGRPCRALYVFCLYSLVALGLAPPGTVAGSLPESAAQEALIPIQLPNGTTIYAELADTPLKRARGLMFREKLAGDRGMLFTFAEAQAWTFWMKNTKISLDIIWMDGKKTIVHIERNAPICTRTDESCPQYQPTEPAVYVLELAGGIADRLKLQRGARLQFP